MESASAGPAIYQPGMDARQPIDSTMVSAGRMASASLVPLRADPRNAFTHVRASTRAGKGAPAASTFMVDYEGFPPEAEAAFQYAVDVWSARISSPVPIRIRAVWTGLEISILGSAGATYVFSDFGAGLANTWYPSALADALAGTDLNPGEADILAQFNASFPNWHFGTSGKAPAGQYDFATVVMHEIGHGLGFAGSMRVDDGVGEAECSGSAGEGCWGLTGYPGLPMSFDRFAVDASAAPLVLDPPYPSPSQSLGAALRSGAVDFSGVAVTAANEGSPAPLYTPANWIQGSSFSHLDELVYPPGHPSSLMTPSLGMAELIHDPGAVGCAVLADIGWTITSFCGEASTLDPPPGPPVLASPHDGETDVPLEPVFSWHAASGALSYEIEVVTLDDPRLVFQQSDVADTTAAGAVLEEDTRYAWRVRASSDAGVGSWSTQSAFVTLISPPGQVTLVTPADGTADVPVMTPLQWASESKASHYRVEAYADPTPSASVFSADSVVATHIETPELSRATTYWWRVQAFNRAGPGPWSELAAFMTVPPAPQEPILISPASGALTPSGPVVLEWLPVADATDYLVQLSQISPIPDDAPTFNAPDPVLDLQGLLTGTTYFWRVKAQNAGGLSRWSPSWTFTTPKPAPGVVSTLFPADSARVADGTVLVQWEPVDQALGYELQFSTDDAFLELVLNLTELTENSILVTDLERERWLVWRIRAWNDDGAGPWSSSRALFAWPDLLPAPLVDGPGDGAPVDSAFAELSWHTEAAATGFHVQVAVDGGLERLVAEDSTLSTPTYSYRSDRVPGTRYWRVRAQNAAGWGAWSDVQSFEHAFGTPTEDAIAPSFSLHQNYPNPFNPTTRIRYSIAETGHVHLQVYDVWGRTIAVLVDEVRPAGAHEVEFDGAGLATGIYVCRLQTGSARQVRAMHLLR